MLFGEFQCKLHVDCYLLLYKTCRILMKFISQNWNLDKLGFRLLIWTECCGVWFKYLDFRFWSGFNNSEITIFVKWQRMFSLYFYLLNIYIYWIIYSLTLAWTFDWSLVIYFLGAKEGWSIWQQCFQIYNSFSLL